MGSDFFKQTPLDAPATSFGLARGKPLLEKRVEFPE